MVCTGDVPRTGCGLIKGDVYSFGMTILEVGSCLFCSHYRELNVVELFTPYANIKKKQVDAKKRENGLPNRPEDERIIKRGLDDKMWKLLCQYWSMREVAEGDSLARDCAR